MIIIKIILTTIDNNDLNAKVDKQFGRAPFFALLETDNLEISFLDNSAANASSGAGVMAAQQVVDEDPAAVIAGNFGPKAFSVLKAAGIKMYSYSGDTVRDAVKLYQDDSLKELLDPTNGAHAGLK